jgi:hypothetical protein
LEKAEVIFGCRLNRYVFHEIRSRVSFSLVKGWFFVTKMMIKKQIDGFVSFFFSAKRVFSIFALYYLTTNITNIKLNENEKNSIIIWFARLAFAFSAKLRPDHLHQNYFVLWP